MAVSVAFFVNGTLFATWAIHIPYVRERLDLGEGTLGLALLAMGAGAMGMMPVTGALVARIGSRRVTVWSAAGLCVLLPLLLAAPRLAGLVVALTAYGVCTGAMDIAMNTQAVVVEHRYERAVMSSFHAMWSLGGLAGAGLGSLVLALGIAPETHVAATAVLMAAATLASARLLLPASVDRHDRAPLVALPRGPLLALGAMGFLAFLNEGSIADWSALYMREVLETGAAAAGTAYAAFSLTMVAGRLSGDALRRRFGAVVLVRASGAIATVGLGGALLLAHPAAAVAGFALVGLGSANIVPLLFSAAGNQPGIAAGTGLAAVAATSYLGILVGPPLIGFAAEATSLPAALGLIAASAAAIAVLASHLRPPHP